jgi:hypothetical protein
VTCPSAATENQQQPLFIGNPEALSTLPAGRRKNGPSYRIARHHCSFGPNESGRRTGVRDRNPYGPTREYPVRHTGNRILLVKNQGYPREDRCKTDRQRNVPSEPGDDIRSRTKETDGHPQSRDRQDDQGDWKQLGARTIESPRGQTHKTDTRLGNKAGLKAVGRTDERHIIMPDVEKSSGHR